MYGIHVFKACSSQKKKMFSHFLVVLSYFNICFVSFLIILSHLETPLEVPWLKTTGLMDLNTINTLLLYLIPLLVSPNHLWIFLYRQSM